MNDTKPVVIDTEKKPLVCPRCGPDWREKHSKRFLVLAITRQPFNGALACVDAELYERGKAAGYYW